MKLKPNVGMKHPVAAAVSAYTPRTSITYGTGFVIDEARSATITWETEDGEFYGDDILLDSANGVTGYTVDFEPTGLRAGVREKLLGEVYDNTNKDYTITGAPSPVVGFGFIRVMKDDTSGTPVYTYEAWWFYRVRFGQPNEESRTKEKNVEWRTPTISGKGLGAFLSADAEQPDFVTHKDFETYAAAETWLNAKANISAVTT